MQSSNGRILLSPSDLNDYVNCRHLTTLAREVARGEREKPHVADEGAQLLQEKGELHELQFLETPACRRSRGGRDRDGRALGLRRRCGPYAGRDARRRGSDLASDVRERPLARPRRLPDEDRRVHRSSARGVTRRSTRSSLAPRSRPTCCSSASTAMASPAFRDDAPSTCTCCLASASNARCATTISRPTTVACERGSKRRSARRRQPRPIRSSIAGCATFAPCVDPAGSPKIISCRWRECAASKSCGCATLDCRR